MALRQSKYDVIVVGGGLIGAAFALKLASETDYRILVLERSAQLIENTSPNQRVLALGNIATRVLQEIGLFKKLNLANCYPYSGMFVWDDASSGELEFSAADYRQDTLGHMVDAVSLTILLQQALGEHPQISVNYQYAIDSLHLEADAARLGDFEAPLVVAADGTHSCCRQQAKIFANRTEYQQKGIVARIKTQLPHADTAWQVFLKSGPLGLLPLANNQASIVWSSDIKRADELLNLSDSDFAQSLTTALDARLGGVELLSTRQAFPLASMQAQTYFKHRLVLIGDAAHSIHPLAGQGANLGFKDVVALVEQLMMAKEPKNLGDLALLARYQRSRKGDNEQTDMFMSVLYKAYQKDAGWWPTLRGAGMNWVNSSERIKSVFAKQAMD